MGPLLSHVSSAAAHLYVVSLLSYGMHNLTPTDMDPSVERRWDEPGQRRGGGAGEMDGDGERERERLSSLSPNPPILF